MRMAQPGFDKVKSGKVSGWMEAWITLFIILFVGLSSVWADGPLTFEDRVKAQEAIERVYYNHRIWPKENPGPKPPFEQMITRQQIEFKVEDYLKKSAALDKFWQRPLSAEQLQAELNRMAKQTQDPDTLRELFASLNDDPTLIAECLVRPVLAGRLIRNWYAQDTRLHSDAAPNISDDGSPAHRREYAGVEFDAWWRSIAGNGSLCTNGQDPGSAEYHLPFIGQADQREASPKGRWVFNSMSDALSGRTEHTAVWTGTEMIVWGGHGQSLLNSGARYDPATDIWTPMSKGEYCPDARNYHTAVWTGTDMIVWGGWDYQHYLKTGGRYDPAMDEWFPVTMGAYSATERLGHTAVWTGTEMIVWGGYNGYGYLFLGGRYDPHSDQWVPMAGGTNCPQGRTGHTAMWTGSEMIVWGGAVSRSSPYRTNTGGRYSPATDTWAPVSTAGYCPDPCSGHTAVWTGSRMIVWGGHIDNSPYRTDRGGVYDPIRDSWMPTYTGTDCPSRRSSHTAVWTGSEMIVWGGMSGTGDGLQDGARYDPTTVRWKALGNEGQLPSGRMNHTAVWSGTELIVWGGALNWYGAPGMDTGGRYNLQSDSWVATSVITRSLEGREEHSAVWTGIEMIVWGGRDNYYYPAAAMHYVPSMDAWSDMAEAPLAGRVWHSAVWTGTEMIVWGGTMRGEVADLYFQDGGRYDPASDTWALMSTGSGCPSARAQHSTIWTGSEMIVWGGTLLHPDRPWSHLGDGGRYDPRLDAWTATPQDEDCPGERGGHTAVWDGSGMIVWGGSGCDTPRCAVQGTQGSGARLDLYAGTWNSLPPGPEARYLHTAVWTGSEMIVWGGYTWGSINSGGRYDPRTGSWSATSISGGCPSPRNSHTAVWTGREMIVWGGLPNFPPSPWEHMDTGGFYDPQTDSWTATSTEGYCPSGRYQHSAVWTGRAMIIWGGYGPLSSGGILQISPHIPSVDAP